MQCVLVIASSSLSLFRLARPLSRRRAPWPASHDLAQVVDRIADGDPRFNRDHRTGHPLNPGRQGLRSRRHRRHLPNRTFRRGTARPDGGAKDRIFVVFTFDPFHQMVSGGTNDRGISPEVAGMMGIPALVEASVDTRTALRRRGVHHLIGGTTALAGARTACRHATCNTSPTAMATARPRR